MIKLKSLLPEQQLPDASMTDLAQGLKRDPMTGNPMPGGAGGTVNLNYKELPLDQLKFDLLVKTFPKNYNQVHFTRMQPDGKEGPYYKDAVTFPNPNDTSTVIGDPGIWNPICSINISLSLIKVLYQSLKSLF